MWSSTWQLAIVITFVLYPMNASLRHLQRQKTTASIRRWLSGTSFGKPQPSSKGNAYEEAQKLGNKMPCIILVNPFLDQNVGSVARTMMNFGLTELRVVNPECDILSDDAQALSAGAFDIIRNAKVFNNVSDCVADLTHIYATSDRPRHMTQMMYTPKKAAEVVLDVTYSDEKAGIMFGRERTGLFNEEMALATAIVTIPTFNHFSSLNLAQSVNIICYELGMRNDHIRNVAPPEQWLQRKDRHRLANRDDLNNFFRRLEASLEQKMLSADDTHRANLFVDIRNIFQRVSNTLQQFFLVGQPVLTSLRLVGCFDNNRSKPAARCFDCADH
jgi:tRNA/rRNA methyltransferase